MYTIFNKMSLWTICLKSPWSRTLLQVSSFLFLISQLFYSKLWWKTLMVNFICQLDWPIRFPDNWCFNDDDIFQNKINMCISLVSKEIILQCGWAYSISKKVWEWGTTGRLAIPLRDEKSPFCLRTFDFGLQSFPPKYSTEGTKTFDLPGLHARACRLD